MSTSATPSPIIPFDNSYARLGAAASASPFHQRQTPQPARAPSLLRLNRRLARELGLDLDTLEGQDAALLFAGNRLPPGAEPIAMAYAGHQFGHWVPVLGDGRAVLLGEFFAADGERRDVQLKGSGTTPFSRNGDGRSALGPVVREYVVSEAMAGLGIPTTRALAMVRTGEQVLRQWGPEPGGVLTRIARSHVRVGTFQFFLGQADHDALRALTRYVIERHYPEAADAANPAFELLVRVSERTADLVARWQLVGFIHGVMNTDNMSVAGETLDFGPCAFMDDFHPAKVFSSIDRQGRYAWSNQPHIGAWNMARLADTLLPQLATDQEEGIELAREALARYGRRLDATLTAGWRAKLGLAVAREEDGDLVAALLTAMADNQADFTRTFRALCDLPAVAPAAAAGQDPDGRARREFADPEAFDAWSVRYRERLAYEERGDADRRAAMRATNPKFIARNHQVQRVIDAVYAGDGEELLDDLLTVLAAPFDDHPTHEELAAAPLPEEVVERTFCGT